MSLNIMTNIKDYMAEKHGVDKNARLELCIFKSKQYGTTTAGLRFVETGQEGTEYIKDLSAPQLRMPPSLYVCSLANLSLSGYFQSHTMLMLAVCAFSLSDLDDTLVSGIDLDVMTKHQRLHDGEARHRQECHSGALHPQLQAARNHHGQATAARYQIDYGDLHGFVHCLAYQKQAHSDTSHAAPPLQHILSTCLSVLGGFQMLLLHMKIEASRSMICKRRTATTKQRWSAAEASVVTSAATFGAKTSSATKTSSRVGSTVATFW